jgi:hypothetical protein
MDTENIHDTSSIDPLLTIPVSVRIPARLAYQLTLYSKQLNTSTGKIMASILEDVLPAFTEGQSGGVRIRIAQAYIVMDGADLLQAVNVTDLKEALLKRAS